MAKHKVEVFTSGRSICEKTVQLVKELVCSSCDLTIYDLNKGCETNECRDKAVKYGIRRVPAVVVDNAITEDSLRAAGIGVK